jgi:hypothetical protein
LRPLANVALFVAKTDKKVLPAARPRQQVLLCVRLVERFFGGFA